MKKETTADRVLKLPSAYATEIFVNTFGDLAIQQSQPDLNCEDPIVLLTRDQARLLAAQITRLDADDLAWEVCGTGEGE